MQRITFSLKSPFRETYAKNHLFTRITFSRNICKKSSFHSNHLFEKHMQRSSNMCFNFFDLYILSQPHPKFDKRLTHFFGIDFRFLSQPHPKFDKRLTHFFGIDFRFLSQPRPKFDKRLTHFSGIDFAGPQIPGFTCIARPSSVCCQLNSSLCVYVY